MSKQKQLDAIKKDIEDNLVCPLKDAATNIVFGFLLKHHQKVTDFFFLLIFECLIDFWSKNEIKILKMGSYFFSGFDF